jgi:hypothetical protein
MNMSGELRFSKDGRWFHQGEEFTHEKIKNYFSRHLRYSEKLQRYVVEVDGRCVAVEVEDTPFVVRSIDTGNSPWTVVLNNGERRPFYADTLLVAEDGSFSCCIENGSQRARLLSAAMQKLLPFIEQADDGRYLICIAGRTYPINSHAS